MSLWQKLKEAVEKASLKAVEKFAPELKKVREQKLSGARQLLQQAADKFAYIFNSSGYKVKDKEIGRKDWILNGFWADVESSWVLRIKFIQETNKLYVQFSSGAICCYNGIDAGTAIQMFSAPSLGKFVHAHLKSLPYTRVT